MLGTLGPCQSGLGEGWSSSLLGLGLVLAFLVLLSPQVLVFSGLGEKLPYHPGLKNKPSWE